MNKVKCHTYKSVRTVVQRLRDDFKSGNQQFVLLYAYNGIGKTRISMEFKDKGKKGGNRDTLYFNAFTEDLFIWDNDLDNDRVRTIKFNAKSQFFAGLQGLALEESIQLYLGRYADFDFDIDYATSTISFSKAGVNNIKVSRGEENIFIWCMFMAILERVIDRHTSYSWVRYVYIDDPISSLDDNNAISVACDLAKLLKRDENQLKVVFSSHHALFFNVVCNELKKKAHKRYFLYRPNGGESFVLQATDETPFFHHVAMLDDVRAATASGTLYTYHFNKLRGILEKTAIFFGYNDFSACIHGVDDEALFARALNLLSHGQYAIFEPREMGEDNKQLFKQILDAFLAKYEFALPELSASRAT